jgi:hypothetical protein
MQDQADLESSRASSASDVSTLGGRYLSLPLSDVDKSMRRRIHVI